MHDRATLPFEAWPDPIKAQWEKFCAPAETPFDDAGPASYLAPSTQHAIQRDWGRWLLWRLEHFPGAADQPNQAHFNPHTLKAFGLEQAKRLNPISLSCLFSHLEQMAQFSDPGIDWNWIADLRRRVSPLGRKIERSPMPNIPIQKLYELGHGLMQKALARSQTHPERHLIVFRDGLIIAVLAACPLRIRNLADLRLGETIIRSETAYRIRFKADEMKNRRPFSILVPGDLTEALELYLEEIRPWLLDQQEALHLWITKNGAPMPNWSLQKQIKHRTKQGLGVAISPHQFRALAATDAAQALPSDKRVAQDLLGHSTIETTEKYYLRSRQELAAKRWEQTMSKRKAELRVYKDG